MLESFEKKGLTTRDLTSTWSKEGRLPASRKTPRFVRKKSGGRKSKVSQEGRTFPSVEYREKKYLWSRPNLQGRNLTAGVQGVI